ncbi:MAG TPA: hypothetical protein VGD55_03535 [Acidothermaceae bacterium]
MTELADWVESCHGPLRPLAYHPLEGRPGFKMALTVVDDRWYLYLGHLWHSGWTILDVTDPAAPEQVAFLPGPPGAWTLQVTIRDNLLATSLEPVPGRWGGDTDGEFDEGVYIWDISTPTAPERLSHYKTGHHGTHRNKFDENGLLHLAARTAEHEGMILVLLDVSDPTAPREVGRFSMGKQAPGETDSEGVLRFGLHGPSLRVDDIAYLPYGDSGLVVLDVADSSNPQLLGHLSVRPPLGSQVAAHSAVPLPDRNLLILNSEAIAENCEELPQYAAMVDISDPRHPRMISLFPAPTPEPESGFTSFCQKGGRFGPHNQHIGHGDPNLFNDDQVCFLTYFNAGLRVYDTRDPHDVREVASLIPKSPTERIGMLPRTLTLQAEDVLVDRRGVVYMTEKNSGLYIAQWQGLS